MRAAMAEASVGDDVFGDDPTVNELQETVAGLLGKQAALFMPSGTQSNLCAVLAHCDRGDEFLIGDCYHVLCHEAGGTAVLGSTMPSVLPTTNGAVSADDVVTAIKPDDPHYPRTRLLCLENTVLGRALELPAIKAPAETAREHGLRVHLDGARLFNAATATGISAQELAGVADSVSLCLSKGLGAPAGSVLAADAATIARAHRLRKMLGGGMRQAGVLAAAGLYALNHHVERLAKDHLRAQQLCDRLNTIDNLWQQPAEVHTNMVFIEPRPSLRDDLFMTLSNNQLIVGAPAARKRLVVHLDITNTCVNRLADTCKEFARNNT